MTGPLQALAARYDRLATRGEVPAYGYSIERISYALVLSSSGDLLDVQSLQDLTGKKPQPRPILVPQAIKRTSGVASNFLWDKTSYVLGVSGKVGGRVAQEHMAFKALHEELLAETDDIGLRALLAFLRAWTPGRFASPPFSADMLDTNLVFRLDGDVLLHDRSAARRIWASRLSSAESVEGMCLVTGMTGPTARLHPAIKGVMGAQSSGASLVSFNLDAFTSYGKEQGANAPVSEAAAFGYGAVLNALLARGSRNLVRIGDATTVFWAETPEAEAIVRGLFDPPPPDEEGEAAVVRDVLEAMAKGRPVEQAAPDVEPRHTVLRARSLAQRRPPVGPVLAGDHVRRAGAAVSGALARSATGAAGLGTAAAGALAAALRAGTAGQGRERSGTSRRGADPQHPDRPALSAGAAGRRHHADARRPGGQRQAGGDLQGRPRA